MLVYSDKSYDLKTKLSKSLENISCFFLTEIEGNGGHRQEKNSTTPEGYSGQGATDNESHCRGYE